MPRQPRPYTARQERIGTVVTRVGSRVNTWLYRLTGGRIGGRVPRGAPICLLTTTGRRSGRPRTVALLYLRDGDDVVLVASKGGMSHHPDWYHNLVADPEVTLEVGSDRFRARARTASPAERARLWPEVVARYRGYATYQERTDREIPVVICSPVPAGGGDTDER